MIQPNFNLMLWIIFICYVMKGFAQILLGAQATKKETEYGLGDVVEGLILLALMVWVALG